MSKKWKTLLPAVLLILLLGCDRGDKVAVTFQIQAPGVAQEQPLYLSLSHPGVPMPGKRLPLTHTQQGLWELSQQEKRGSAVEVKVFKGRRRAEAMDSTGVELPPMRITANRDTTITLTVRRWSDSFHGPVLISRRRLQANEWKLPLRTGWLVRIGDDSLFSSPQLDESQWTRVSLLNRRESPLKFIGVVWFRLHVMIDSSLVGYPLSLQMQQQGASEIYRDGAKLFAYGVIGASADEQQNRNDRNPRPLIFQRAGEHLISVRYSTFQSFRRGRFGSPLPFDLVIGDLQRSIPARVHMVRSSSILQLVFSVIPLSFALIHLLLFVFYPRHKNNLFYAISMLGFAALAFVSFADVFMTTPMPFIVSLILILASTNIAISFSMLSVYATVYKKLPWPAYSSFAAITFIMLMIVFFPRLRDLFQPVTFILLTLGIADMIRLTIVSGHKKKNASWIVSVGFALTLLVFAYQFVLFAGMVRPIGNVIFVWIYGIPILAVSLSTYISLNFSRTQKQLQTQLVRVKELSEQALLQERRAKEEEIQRRLLLADNERKTHELEEARKLQLSMLPRTLPDLPFLDIAVSMRTATEVGGDYYDFRVNDETLTVAIGDATGHGMKAGAMVAAIKSLFSEHSDKKSLTHILDHWSQVIRRMSLGNLYMAMSLLRIDKDGLRIANAGMPPALLYRRSSGRIEEIVIKGMPLGGAAKFNYVQKEIAVVAGDVLLLLSDGFAELFNENNDMFDQRALEAFRAVAEQPPQSIIDALNRTCDDWRGARPQHDDITFVVLRFT